MYVRLYDQMTIITTQVDSGKLTLEGYLVNLEKAIAKDKTLFLALKQRKDLNNAKLVAQRVGIMTKELKGARAQG